MQQVFSPRQVARAIGASESSVKRWCDRGVLPSVKTAGGHRRLPISGVLEFLRSENRALNDPTAIGLPKGAGSTPSTSADALQPFKQALTSGDYSDCRRILYDLVFANVPLAVILDEVVTIALHEMGEDWCAGSLEVYEERRGCELVTRLVHELAMTIPLPPETAPVAMGASVEGDPYTLASRFVEMILIDSGWKATSLGSGVPIASLAKAIEVNRPRLFWVSSSSVADEQKFISDFEILSSACGETTALIIGGRGFSEPIRSKLRYTACCENLQRLESLVAAIHNPKEK